MAFVVKSPTNHLPPALRIPECPQVARSTPSLALLQIPGRSGKNWGGRRGRWEWEEGRNLLENPFSPKWGNFSSIFPGCFFLVHSRKVSPSGCMQVFSKSGQQG
jgi:hypothetical protein